MSIPTKQAILLLFCFGAAVPSLARTTYAGAIAIPGTLQVENYDNGTQGIEWYDKSPGNAFGVYRTNTDVDVGAINGGGHHIGGIEAGEWVEYTVNVANAGPHTVRIRYASAYTGTTTFRLLQDGTDVGGGLQSVTSTGGWQTFTDTKTMTANLAVGTHILRLEFVNGAWNPDSLQFSFNSCTAPTVTNPAGRTANPHTTQTFSVTASGTAPLTYEWRKNNVPITGNPSAATSRLTLTNVEMWKDAGSYTVKVTNGCNASRTSTAAVLRIPCGTGTGKPGWVQENITEAFVGKDEYTCDWEAFVVPGMPNSFSFQGSYNIPVLAAAVAFIEKPVTPTWDMRNFWTQYLRGELGDRGTEWYYGGKELGSYVYQAYNETAVMAVHYHAHFTGQTEIENLARRWLRATFTLHSLAGVPARPLTLHAKGQTDTPSVPYNGPYTAFAGDRSSWGYWVDPDRNILLARAVNLPFSVPNGESTGQKDLRMLLEGWKDASDYPLVYGLTSTERSQLVNAINQRTLPSDLISGTDPLLGPNLRTYSRYDIVAWPAVKATVMWQNLNNYTAPTFGVAYFTNPNFASGREAHFLYPWQGLWDGGASSLDRVGICPGTARLDPGVMSATHPDCYAGTVLKHKAETVSINLPTTTPNYRVTLQSTQGPSCSPACP